MSDPLLVDTHAMNQEWRSMISTEQNELILDEAVEVEAARARLDHDVAILLIAELDQE